MKETVYEYTLMDTGIRVATVDSKEQVVDILVRVNGSAIVNIELNNTFDDTIKMRNSLYLFGVARQDAEAGKQVVNGIIKM